MRTRTPLPIALFALLLVVSGIRMPAQQPPPAQPPAAPATPGAAAADPSVADRPAQPDTADDECVHVGLVDGELPRVHRCANHRCVRVFYDASRNGKRRWCEMATCGNRAKAARHRRKLKLES